MPENILVTKSSPSSRWELKHITDPIQGSSITYHAINGVFIPLDDLREIIVNLEVVLFNLGGGKIAQTDVQNLVELKKSLNTFFG